MNRLLIIAGGEWKYWLRSYLVLSGTGLFLVLLIATSWLNALGSARETVQRAHHQSAAEETFVAQPDRHPHRMVHYGHYVFRAPAPLVLFDPGLDSVTGQSIFLEGHRQNSAMFADSGASANLGGLSWLTPAVVYQLFGPLLIILLGHSCVVREREAGTLALLLTQGIDGRTLLFGKALAFLSFVLVLLLPLTFSAVFGFVRGESLAAVVSLVGVYCLYLLIWVLLTLLVSSLLRHRSTNLAMLTSLWLALAVVMPSIAVNVAAYVAPMESKIQTDLHMLEDLRKLGDGHNANDPAFEKLRNNLFKQYGVTRVEDLPVNFRGLVAMSSEEKLTEVLNAYAEERMNAETDQARVVSQHNWLSPTLSIAVVSRALSGTDLVNYHRFLRQAEDVRFDFVQSLNQAHVEKLSYQHDINRGRDEASSLKARVDSSNWQALNKFQFEPSGFVARATNARQPFIALLVWFGVALGGLVWAGWRLKP